MPAPDSQPERTYVTELGVPEPVRVLQVLHSRMLPPDPELEPEADL